MKTADTVQRRPLISKKQIFEVFVFVFGTAVLVYFVNSVSAYFIAFSAIVISIIVLMIIVSINFRRRNKYKKQLRR